LLQQAFSSIPKWFFFLLILVAFELIADILAKQFAISGKYIFALLSIAGFIAANAAWLISLRTGAQLGKGAVLFSVLSAIGAVVIAVLLYHEKVTTYQIIGLVLGVAAITLLSIE
jgi:multidrug transporter EmrE-like cation transporter